MTRWQGDTIPQDNSFPLTPSPTRGRGSATPFPLVGKGLRMGEGIDFKTIRSLPAFM